MDSFSINIVHPMDDDTLLLPPEEEKFNWDNPGFTDSLFSMENLKSTLDANNYDAFASSDPSSLFVSPFDSMMYNPSSELEMSDTLTNTTFESDALFSFSSNLDSASTYSYLGSQSDVFSESSSFIDFESSNPNPGAGRSLSLNHSDKTLQSASQQYIKRPRSKTYSELSSLDNVTIYPVSSPRPRSNSSSSTSNPSLSKKFACPLCTSMFSRNHDLKRHVRIHLGIRPYKCEACEKAFTRADALKFHKSPTNPKRCTLWVAMGRD